MSPEARRSLTWKYALGCVFMTVLIVGSCNLGTETRERVPEEWENICAADPDSLRCFEARDLHHRRMEMVEAMQDAGLID